MSNHRHSERPTLRQYPLLPTKVAISRRLLVWLYCELLPRSSSPNRHSFSSKKLLAHQAQINGRAYMLDTAGFTVLT